MVIGLILSGALTSHEMFSNIRVFSNTALVAFATVLLLRLLPLVHYLPTTKSMRGVCSAVYHVADIVLTYFLNGLRFVLSLFDILTGLQAQLLFNTAYARQVMADTQLEYSVLPKLVEQALKQQQEARMQMLQQQSRAQQLAQ